MSIDGRLAQRQRPAVQQVERSLRLQRPQPLAAADDGKRDGVGRGQVLCAQSHGQNCHVAGRRAQRGQRLPDGRLALNDRGQQFGLIAVGHVEPLPVSRQAQGVAQVTVGNGHPVAAGQRGTADENRLPPQGEHN